MLKHLRDKKVSWWFKPVTSYFELSFVEQLFTPKMTSTIAFVEAKSFTTKIFNISHIQINILLGGQVIFCLVETISPSFCFSGTFAAKTIVI